MKKTYLAARFPRREELEGYVPKFEKAGFQIVSRWVFGGEEGLNRQDIALLDIDDVDKADVLILFTEPYGSLNPGGGRFVEFGYALALNKELHIIGERENVFMHHPFVKTYPTVEEFFRSWSPN